MQTLEQQLQEFYTEMEGNNSGGLLQEDAGIFERLN